MMRNLLLLLLVALCVQACYVRSQEHEYQRELKASLAAHNFTPPSLPRDQ